MRTVAEIINLWPSPAEFAADLGLKSDVHARTMRQRGSIARWYWEKVEAAAQRRGIALAPGELKIAHAGKRQFGSSVESGEAA